MRLKVNSCGTQGAQTWQSEPKMELVNIQADGITAEMASNVVTELRAGTDRLVIDELVISDDGQIASLAIRSEVSPVHLREQTHVIRRIVDEELKRAGVAVERPVRSELG